MKKTLFMLLCLVFILLSCNEDEANSSGIPVSDIKISQTTLSLTEGEKDTLTVTIVPADAINKSVIWFSSDTTVATVAANGEVTGVKAGEATITVTTVEGGKQATCAVTITASASIPEKMYLVGSMPGSSDWSTWQAMIPVTDVSGKFWSIQYFAAGDGMKFNRNATMDRVVGYTDGLIPAASATLVGGVTTNADKNIIIGKAGWYIVIISAGIKDASLNYSLEFAAPNVYITGDPLTAGWGEVKDVFKFKVPSNGEGNFEYALVNGKSGMLRIFAQLPGVDWWRTEFLPFGGKIEYRANRGELAKNPNNISYYMSSGEKIEMNFIKNTSKIN